MLYYRKDQGMKKTVLIILILTTFSCNQEKKKNDLHEKLTDNLELLQIYQNDQSERQIENIDWEILLRKDSIRLIRVNQLLDSNKVRTSNDYHNAAMIFQHGYDTIASGMAVKLMRMSLELDSTANKWLLAAAIDRDLMRRNQPQIYGTQYLKMGEDAPWELYKLDSTKITDSERKEYGVETLAEQREKIKKMNEK